MGMWLNKRKAPEAIKSALEEKLKNETNEYKRASIQTKIDLLEKKTNPNVFWDSSKGTYVKKAEEKKEVEPMNMVGMPVELKVEETDKESK